MHVSALTAKSPAVDFTALADGRVRPQLPPAQQAHAAAQQFEAILIRQLLAQSVGKMLASGSGGSDTGSDIYGFMLTDSIADKIAQGGGLGLAPMLEKQFAPKAPPAAAPAQP
ncbi:MAG: rod-binding protein [Opitutae bacterium]|nr:rod-binding protein [Opitutae bacterium]